MQNLTDKEKNDLTTFYGKVTEILQARLENGQRFPELFIYIGPGDFESVVAVRSGLPENTLLFYLSPAEAEFSRELPLTIFSRLDEKTLYLEKIALMVEKFRCKSVQLSMSEKFEKRFQNDLDLIGAKLDLSINNWVQDHRGRLIFLRNSLCNLPRILSDKKLGLVNLEENIPAVICSAGPSLSEQLDILKKYSENMIVISVGRVYSILVNSGIEPDFVVEIDPSDITWKTHSHRDVGVLVAASHIFPRVAERFSKIVWIRGDSQPFDKLLKVMGTELTSLSMSRTVTVTAIDLAIKLGCKNIALIGSDLCLSASGAQYSSEKDNAGKIEDFYIEIEGNDGKVKTVSNLETLKATIENYLAGIGSESKVYNCTKGGALIRNCSRKDFGSFCNEFASASKHGNSFVKEILQQCVRDFSFLREPLEIHIKILEETGDLASRLFDEMQSQSPNLESMRALQERIRELAVAEVENKKNAFLQPILSSVDIYVDEILYDSFLMRKNSPLKQLEKFCLQYQLTKDLCKDILSDTQMKPGHNSRAFTAFRNFAISFVEKSNEGLADFLKANPDSSYEAIPHLQHIISDIYRPDGSVFYRMSLSSFEQEADIKLQEFMNLNKFNPENDRVVFLAPVNWLYPIKFSERFPDSGIMVVEPWGEMFSAVIDKSMFMHQLAEDTVVVCMDVKNGKAVYNKTIEHWKSLGKRVLFFKHPSVFNDFQIIKAFEDFEKMQT